MIGRMMLRIGDGADFGSGAGSAEDVVSVAVVVVGVLLVRPRRRPARADLPLLMSIGLLTTAADAMYAVATTIGLLGVVAVLAALHSVVTMGFARVVLHERLAGWQRIGIAACLCGVAVLAAA